MKKLGKKGVFAVTVILICAGLLFIPSLLAGVRGRATVEITETPVLPVRIQESRQQTLVAHLDVNGDIVSTQQANVFPDVAGRLVSVHASLGSFVQQGQIIAMVDPSRPGATFMNSPVHAPLSGFISRTPLSVGETVGPGTSITTVSAGGALEINTRIPEREIAGLVPGLRAQVSLQAFSGETFGATVIRVSPIVDAVSRTKLVTLSFDQNDNRLSPGMFARVRINTRTYNDVISVPAEAVVLSLGTDAVFVASYDHEGQLVAVRREVARGVTLQGWTEIRSGLQAGENVIVQGQQLLSGGERLRVIGGTAVAGGPITGGVQ